MIPLLIELPPLRRIASIFLQAPEPSVPILTTYFLMKMYGFPPCFAMRLQVFLEGEALSVQRLPI